VVIAHLAVTIYVGIFFYSKLINFFKISVGELGYEGKTSKIT